MKKVIGYKIDNKRFLAAANALLGLGANLELSEEGTHFKEGSIEHKALDKAGVVGLWCTAICKDSILFKRGSWYKRLWNDGDVDVFRVENDAEEEGEIDYNKFYFRNGNLLGETSGNSNIELFLEDDRYKAETASDEVVQKLMVAEAVKRGYEKGNHICLVGEEDQFNTDSSLWFYNIGDNSLFTAGRGNGGSCVLRSGVWATFKNESPVLPKIKGYEGSDNGKHIVYGCTEFKKKRLRALLDLKVTAFKIKTPEGIVDVDSKDVKMLEAYLLKD